MPSVALMFQKSEHNGEFSKWDLKSFGISFYVVDSVAEAERLSSTLSVEIILIDGEGLEDRGLTALASLKLQNVPVVLIIDDATDFEFQIAAFKNGASDVLFWNSPIRLQALRLRKLTVSESLESVNEDVVQVADLVLDPRTLRATYKNSLLQLTGKQFQLLLFLAQNIGNYLHRQTLADKLRQRADNRNIDMIVSRVRGSLRNVNADDFRLESAYGLGYRLSRFKST